MRGFALAMGFACVISAGFAADPPKFSTPEPKEMADDLRNAGPQDQQYPLPQDAAKSKKLREASLAWYREQFVEPFVKGPSASGKGAEKAKEALEACSRFYSAQRTFYRQTAIWEECTHKLEDAVKAGCGDPMVNYFYIQHYAKIEKAADRAEAYGKSLEALEKAKAPPYIRAKVSLQHSFNLYLAAKQAGEPRGKGKKAFEATMRCLAELSKDRRPPAQDALLDVASYVLINYRNAGWGRDNGFLDLNEVLADAGAPAALLQALKGDFLVQFAWDARGSGSAGTVTEEGYANFRSRLQEAQTAFEASWDADSTQDVAAAGMVTVCMGLGLEREEMEKWFQRAMTANPDSFRACVAKLNYLFPRWHGSEEDTIAFARQCLRTKNYYAGLPYILIKARRSDFPNFRKFSEFVGTDPIAWADVREYYENALQHSKSDRDLLTEYAVVCAGAGQWSAAKKHLNALENEPANNFFPSPKDFETFRKEVEDHVKKKAKK